MSPTYKDDNHCAYPTNAFQNWITITSQVVLQLCTPSSAHPNHNFQIKYALSTSPNHNSFWHFFCKLQKIQFFSRLPRRYQYPPELQVLMQMLGCQCHDCHISGFTVVACEILIRKTKHWAKLTALQKKNFCLGKHVKCVKTFPVCNKLKMKGMLT